MVTLKEVPIRELLLKGNASCPGCGSTLALRWVLKILGEEIILIIPAGCGGVYQGMFPASAFKVPVVNSAFGAQAAVAAGLASALKMRDRKELVVVWSGDGGTADIGIQAISAAAERNDDILYFCYDNEAYMNTGIQRSSLTPFGAWTTTTPEGKKEFKKNMPLIMAAHNIPYIATASVGYPLDLMTKVKKAANMRGLRYIHILTPCPPGWRTPENLTVELGKLAVKSGLWPLYEIENGKLRINRKGRPRTKVEDYLKLQGRFVMLTESDIQKIQHWVDEQLNYLENLERLTSHSAV